MTKKLRKPLIDPKKYQNFIKSSKSSKGDKIFTLDYQNFKYNTANIPEEAVFSTRDDSVDDIQKDLAPETGKPPKKNPPKDKTKNTTTTDDQAENTEQVKAKAQKQKSLVDQIKNPTTKGEADAQLKIERDSKNKLVGFYWLIGGQKVPTPKHMGLKYFQAADATSPKYAGDKETAIRNYETEQAKNKKNPEAATNAIKKP